MRMEQKVHTSAYSCFRDVVCSAVAWLGEAAEHCMCTLPLPAIYFSGSSLDVAVFRLPRIQLVWIAVPVLTQSWIQQQFPQLCQAIHGRRPMGRAFQLAQLFDAFTGVPEWLLGFFTRKPCASSSCANAALTPEVV